MNSTYHFQVPNTKINYTIKIEYQNELLRGFEIVSIIWNSRSVNVNEIPSIERELFIKHISSKIKTINVIK
jgi:hypothetical protein